MPFLASTVECVICTNRTVNVYPVEADETTPAGRSGRSSRAFVGWSRWPSEWAERKGVVRFSFRLSV